MIKDYYRFANFVIFFLISLVSMIVMLKLHNTFFYLTPPNNFHNWPRLVFAFVSVLLGFSFAIYLSSQHHIPEKRPFSVFASYFTKYLITTLVLSTIIFVIFSAINATSGYLYYFITAAVGIGIGYLIDLFAAPHGTVLAVLQKFTS